METKRTKVLIFAEWFYPGYKAGGPITSITNFVDQLKKDLDLYVFTTDRDLGDNTKYSGVQTDIWENISGCHVFYTSPENLNRRTIKEVLDSVSPDIVYLNSMYSYYFTILPLIITKTGKQRLKVILSPRGMLKPSAISHKKWKKKLFLILCRKIGLMRHIEFHATDIQESKDIKTVFGEAVQPLIMGNLPAIQSSFVQPPQKKPGELKLIFVGRVHPIKNLLYLLEAVRSSKVAILLTIVGPVEDEAYWRKCKQVISEFRADIKVREVPDINHEGVLNLVREHHVFVLPTAGENFGHAIFEALSVGRPVLISDQTPWRNLSDHKAGWDLSLTDKNQFTMTIDRAGEWENVELLLWCKGAWSYCSEYLRSNELRTRYLKLFTTA